MSADHRAATGRPRGSSRSCRWRSPRPEPAVHGCGLIEAGDLVAALAQRSHGSLPVEQVSGGVEPVGVGCVAGQRARTRGCRRRAPVRAARSFQTKNNGKQLIYALTWGQFLKLRVSGQPLRPFFVIPVRGTRSAPVPTVVLVVLGGDAGGGLLTELDVDAERGQVPVAGLGLEFGGAAALGGEMGQSAVAQLVEGVPGAVGSWGLAACLNRYSARG